MKDGWIACPLANFVTARPGNNKIIKGKESDRPSAALVQGFSASGPDVWVKTADYEQDGVVVSAVGARCGKTFLAQGKWTAIANTHVLLPGPEIDHRWLWYRTNDETFWSRGGTAQPFVKIKETLLRECEIPPLAEQRRIVAILDEAFEGIEVARANAERNLRNVREWADRQLAVTLATASSEGGSGHLESLVAVGCSLSYGIVQPGDDVPGGLPVVRPVDLSRRQVDLDGIKRIDPELARSYSRTTLRGGDLLLCVRGTTGTVSVAAQTLAGANVTRGIVPIRFDPKLITQAMGYYLLRSEPFQAQVRAKTYGTALMQINIGDLRKIVLTYPPLERQAALVEQLDSVQKAADQLEAVYLGKLAALDELKQSLLHQAFTGAL